MAQLNYSDFYQVPGLKFDIKKLRDELDVVLKKKGFVSPKGVSNFGAIPLNKVPQIQETRGRKGQLQPAQPAYPLYRAKRPLEYR